MGFIAWTRKMPWQAMMGLAVWILACAVVLVIVDVRRHYSFASPQVAVVLCLVSGIADLRAALLKRGKSRGGGVSQP